MAAEQDPRRVVGLDIGTSKVVAMVAEIGADGGLEIIGIGAYPSRGLKKGVVVNIDSTTQSIQRAVEEAELMAGCQIDTLYAGIAGSHIRSLNSHGIVGISDGEVYPGMWSGSLTRHRQWPFLQTRKFCTSFRRITSLILRKTLKSRWACLGCGSRPRYIW